MNKMVIHANIKVCNKKNKQTYPLWAMLTRMLHITQVYLNTAECPRGSHIRS